LESISLSEVRAFGEERPAAFFRDVVEALADSFHPPNVAVYERVMSAWGLSPVATATEVPAQVDLVYVLSRVTLGADIKITSMILDAMKLRFPDARIVFVGNRKSAELFQFDARVEHFEAQYPRTGPVSARIAWGHELRARLEGARRIVVDPDSRMTQLGLVSVCERENYFHFPSRSYDCFDNLTDLTNRWLTETFGVTGDAYVAPQTVAIDAERPRVAVSLGVGENECKRIGDDFETSLLRKLGTTYRTVWVDRGAGGEEARRVTAAAAASGVSDRVRFWEGSFAGFVSIIMQSDFYVGYDSAGQHAAAAAGVPLLSIFKGAPSEIFRNRWAPQGPGDRTVLNADELTPAQIEVVKTTPASGADTISSDRPACNN
jgi:ADP-heptose:LPS heptosyltransferase